MSTSRRRLVVLFAVCFVVACESGIAVSPSSVAPIEHALESFTLTVGKERALVLDAGRSASWQSSDESVATVSQTGVVAAKSPGAARIVALADRDQYSAIVTVVAESPDSTASQPSPSDSIPETTPASGAAATVTVTLDSSRISAGHTAQASAVAADAQGQVLPGTTPAWTTLTPKIASISPTGVVTGLSAGLAVFSARIGEASGGAFLTVTAPSNAPGSTATVIVTLDSSNLAVGNTAHATAVAKDANGTTLSGKVPQWASQNTSIATVTAAGTVTGVSAGTTRIQATLDGIVASASLPVGVPSVVAAPMPTPGYPNQPASFTRLVAQSFDSLENADYYSSGGTYSIVQDASSPEGSSNVGQIKFPAGFGSGSAPAALFQRVVPFAARPTQVYISFWVKISSNWVGNAAGANKILYMNVNGQNAGSIEFLGMGGLDGTNQTVAPMLVLENVANVAGVGSPSAALVPNVVPYSAASAVVRGTWNHYEVVLTLNTPGNADGGVKWWWNGTLYGDFTGRVQWTDTAGAMFTDVYWDPTYGGAGPAVPADQYMWMKNLYVSGR